MSQKKKSVYASIAEDILTKIKSDVYPIGTLLPPEREFMSIYSVQRTTVRRGLDILSAQGYIRKAAGLGSIVNSKVAVDTSAKEDYPENSVLSLKQAESAVLLPNSDTDRFPKLALDLIVSLNKSAPFMTSSIDEISSDTNVICIDSSPDTKRSICLSLCQSDERRSVVLDNDKSAYVALTYLEGLGHREIAFIGTDKGFTYENAVYGSFEAVNSFFDENLVNLSGNDEKAGFEGFSELLRRHGGKFTAVCTVNDEVAKGVIRAAKYYKLNVPEDISVISLCSSSKQSSIDGIFYDTEALAEELLYSAEKSQRIATVLFGGELMIKGSCSYAKGMGSGGKNMSDFLL